MFFDKYLSWLLFSILLTHEYAYKIYNAQSYFFNSFITNQTLDKKSHLSFKQIAHNKKNLYFLYNFFIFSTTFKYMLKIFKQLTRN